jgi:hypothetical protein
MAEEEVTGVLYRVKVDIAALEDLKAGLKQAGQVGTQEIGQVIPKASKKADESFTAFGKGTKQLRAVLAGLGFEGGEVANKIVKLSYAFETGWDKAKGMTIGLIALAGAVAFVASKLSEVSESTAFKKFLDDAKEKVKKLQEEAAKLNDELDRRSPAEKSEAANKYMIGRLYGELEAVEQKKQKILSGLAPGESAASEMGDLNERQKELQGELNKLLAIQDDFHKAAQVAITQHNNEKLAKTIAHGKAEAAEQKRIYKEYMAAFNAYVAEQRRGYELLSEMKLKTVLEQADAAIAAYDKELDAEKAKNAAIAKYEDLYREGHEQLQDETEARNAKIAKNRDRLAEKEKKDAQDRYEDTMKWIDVAQAGAQATLQVAGIFDLFGAKSAKSEKERAEAVGMSLGFENMIMAATETARAVASFAAYQYPAGAMHTIAAALHTAAMIKCFSDPASAGGFSSPSAGGAGGSAAAHGAQMARDAADKREAKESGGVVINIYGNQINAEGADRLFAEGAARWAKKQKPNATTGRL